MSWLTDARFPCYPTYLEQRHGIEAVPALAVVNTPWMLWGSCMPTVSASCQRATLGPHGVAPKTVISNSLCWTCPEFISTLARGKSALHCIWLGDNLMLVHQEKCHDCCKRSFPSSVGRLVPYVVRWLGVTPPMYHPRAAVSGPIKGFS